MALEVYVGNFPSTLTRDDLLHLFQDFKGIELLRTNNVNYKCFAFFRCRDEHQVVDVVTTMHDIDVCGRNLIVRASNEELQSLILETLQENNVLDKHTKNIHHSHSNVNNSNSRFIDKKNFIPSLRDEFSEFPTCMRFRNPLLQSSHVEQPKSESPSDGYNYKPSNQSKYANETQSGLSKRNDSSQTSNKLDVKSQNFPDVGRGRQTFVNNSTGRNTRFINPCLQSQHVEKKNDIVEQQKSDEYKPSNQTKYADESQPGHRNIPTYGPGQSKCNASSQNVSQNFTKPDVKSQNFPDEGTGRQTFMNNSTGRNTQFINPRMQSQHVQKKNVFVEQQRSDGPSDAYKPSNQTKYADESQPGHRNLPFYGPGQSKCNASSQNVSQNFTKPDVKSQNFPDEGAGRDHFVNNTFGRNTRFTNLKSPCRESKNGDHQSTGDHLSSRQPIKPTQNVCDYQTKPFRPNSFNHGTKGHNRNSSSELAQASDTKTERFSIERANMHKYKQHFNESNKHDVANHATGWNSNNKKERNIDDLSHSGSYSSSEYHKDNDRNISNDDKEAVGTCQSPSFDKPITKKQLFYASIANFPLQTTIAELYNLLQDLNPYDIIMICNFPLRDRRPTEAIVCFESEDQVTDAILTFDNTIYFGRALVVTDATDLSILPELQGLNSKRY